MPEPAMTATAWVFAIGFLTSLGFIAFVMWCNDELRRELRTARQEGRR